MVLETIYVVRHATRMTFSVDPYTIRYTSAFPTPTGLPADPALTSYGEKQAVQLGHHLTTLPIDQVISSPYYRCLQTIQPGVDRMRKEKGYKSGVQLDSGFEEWFGQTWGVEQAVPLAYEEMRGKHYPKLDLHWEGEREKSFRPNAHGESIEGLHERVACALHRLIERAERKGWKSVLICSHAAVIIAIGRCLTGNMPEDITTEDFHCYTAGLSKYTRRQTSSSSTQNVDEWDSAQPETIPQIDWKNGKGIAGGWDSILNSDCSFLEGGEERGWHFSGDESFIRDPNSWNDKVEEERRKQAAERESKAAAGGADGLNLNRAVCVAAGRAEDEHDAEEERSKL